MSDKTVEENLGTIPNAPMVIHKQYLKDLSFENPNAPGVLKNNNNRPEMDMNIMLDVQKLEDDEIENLYEVTLSMTATAKRDDETMFVAEVVYGAAVSIHGIDEQQHHLVLFVEIPQMTYPFARQILAAATQAGGFTPLMPNPVDFRAMYLQRFAPNRDKQAAETDNKDEKSE